MLIQDRETWHNIGEYGHMIIISSSPNRQPRSQSLRQKKNVVRIMTGNVAILKNNGREHLKL